MRKFTLAALAVFFAVNLSAQNKYTVSGYIRDAATGETLIGAGVMVMSASVAGDSVAEANDKASGANSRIIGAVTNEFGYYTITVPCGNIELTYSYVGCSDLKQNIDLQRDTIINIALEQAVALKASTVVGRKDAGIQSANLGALEMPQDRS